MVVVIPLPPDVEIKSDIEEKTIPIKPSFNPAANFTSEVNRIIEKYLETYSENTIWWDRKEAVK